MQHSAAAYPSTSGYPKNCQRLLSAHHHGTTPHHHRTRSRSGSASAVRCKPPLASQASTSRLVSLLGFSSSSHSLRSSLYIPPGPLQVPPPSHRGSRSPLLGSPSPLVPVVQATDLLLHSHPVACSVTTLATDAQVRAHTPSASPILLYPPSPVTRGPQTPSRCKG